MTRSVAGVVSVRTGETRASFSGVMCCGGRPCPVCGPALYGANRDDIVQCVRAWREGYGGTVLMGTFTLGHELRDSFEDSAALVAKAWAAVTSGKGWVADRRRHGVAHWVRVFEDKWSDSTGWHCHVHYLVFVEPGRAPDALALLRSMFKRWSRVVSAAGRRVSALAQELHEVDGDSAAAVLGDYFTKQAAASEHATADALGWELTGRDGKRGGGSITPGELLQLAAATDDPRLVALWHEFERGSRRRRMIAWSRGLRQLCGVGDELPAEDVAAAEAERTGTVAMQLWASEYKRVVNKRLRAELLRVTFEHGAAAGVAWLAERGIAAVVGMYDRQGVEVPEDDPGPVYAGALPW